MVLSADMVDVPELHPDHYEDEEWEFWRRAHLEVIGRRGREEASDAVTQQAGALAVSAAIGELRGRS